MPEELWRRSHAGQTVNVRRSKDEVDSSRLDENPQWGTAVVDIAIAAALLMVWSIVSGRWTARRRRPVTEAAIPATSEA